MKSVIETLKNLKANEAEVIAEDEAAAPKTKGFKVVVGLRGTLRFSIDATSEDDAYKKADELIDNARDLDSLGELDLEVVNIDVQ